jgi:hypothetical protein
MNSGQEQQLGGRCGISTDDRMSGERERHDDVGGVRDDIETARVAWNMIRTLAFTASFCCLGRAFFIHARRTSRMSAYELLLVVAAGESRSLGLDIERPPSVANQA